MAEEFPFDQEVASMPRLMRPWVHPCQFRVSMDENKRTQPVCKKISQAVGHSVGVNPRVCANCMLAGEIRQPYLDYMARKIVLQSVKDLELGFFKNEDDVEFLLKKAYSTLKSHPNGRAKLSQSLVTLTNLGRLSSERAVKLVQDHMPELTNGSDTETEGSGKIIKNDE